MRILRGVAFGLLLVLPGCGTTYGLRGQIAGSSSCDKPAPATPLADAHVKITCPGVTPDIEATTDSHGTFSLLEGKALDQACEVTIEKAGYETRRYAAKDLCASLGSGPSCGLATELLPAAASTEGK